MFIVKVILPERTLSSKTVGSTIKIWLHINTVKFKCCFRDNLYLFLSICTIPNVTAIGIW
jgi:hypothetical protein